MRSAADRNVSQHIGQRPRRAPAAASGLGGFVEVAMDVAGMRALLDAEENALKYAPESGGILQTTASRAGLCQP